MAGSNLAPSGGGAAAHVDTCNSADTAQHWLWDTPAVGFLSSAPSPGTCLNMDDCGTDVIYYPCVTSGGTCCGSTCYGNEQFALSGAGALTTALSGNCIEVSGATLAAVACSPGVPAQTWSYDTSTLQLRNAGAGACLTTRASAGGTNVWARPLHDGSWAFAFINVGAAAMNITCDAACFGAAGIKAGIAMNVFDVWSKSALPGFVTPGPYTVPAVEADGGIALLRMTPAASS